MALMASLNRIGNLLVPNSNYCAFEDWVVPILDTLVAEQDGPNGETWSPSKIINRLGKEIDNEESVYYWCYKVGLLIIHHMPFRLDEVLMIERHTCFLPRPDRRLFRRHDLLPHLQDRYATHYRYRTGYPQTKRHVGQGQTGGNDHSGRWGLQASDRKCHVVCMSLSLLPIRMY